ncbi:MATE family Na+-driven efflux transporter [Treponema sp. OMZ 906]|uniref:MATE family Na+-driven efflux transporter n=1 Tax=Treponema sp. OMZ 906 TaxID=2563662 RepID=UPI0020A5C849|nr:MATE family Na+-driven efflux transporter [Treponema sp. OMZ 906]UTC56106.1 multidrug transporter [Treponema sp. OMZ 906]
MNKIGRSLKNLNWKLFISLLVMGLCPSIYITLRVFFLGKLPGDWVFSIAGQLSWVNLLYEILDEAIILPLYFFMGKAINNKNDYTNRIKTGLIISFSVYAVCSVFIIGFTNPLLSIMATSKDIISESVIYIRIESIANIFILLSNFILICLITLGKSRYVYILTAAKLILSIVFDTFLVSTLNISANLGVNGIGYSNIIVNIILFAVSVVLLSKEGYKIFNKEKLSFTWAKEFVKIGGISGLESFVRNIAYMLMISRMVNMVNEQGTYWVANSFIWGWLLLPINQLGELIKQEVSTDEKAIKNNTLGYFAVTAIVCLVWFITIPGWKGFMANVLQFSDVDKLYNLVMVLLGFYVLYALQNVFDCEFYGLGKTNYMLFESIVTNSIYYGIAFALYLAGKWTPTLMSIALLFGVGNAFDSIVSGGAFAYLLKKKKINIFEVE